MFHRQAQAWQFSHVIMLNVSNNKFMLHFMFWSNTLAIHFSLGEMNFWDKQTQHNTTPLAGKRIQIYNVSMKVLMFLCSWSQSHPILLCYLNRIMIADFSREILRLQHLLWVPRMTPSPGSYKACKSTCSRILHCFPRSQQVSQGPIRLPSNFKVSH